MTDELNNSGFTEYRNEVKYRQSGKRSSLYNNSNLDQSENQIRPDEAVIGGE